MNIYPHVFTGKNAKICGRENIPFYGNFYGHSPSADSRRLVFINKRTYVHKVLVYCLVKLAQEKVWLGELTFSE